MKSIKISSHARLVRSTSAAALGVALLVAAQPAFAQESETPSEDEVMLLSRKLFPQKTSASCLMSRLLKRLAVCRALRCSASMAGRKACRFAVWALTIRHRC